MDLKDKITYAIAIILFIGVAVAVIISLAGLS